MGFVWELASPKKKGPSPNSDQAETSGSSLRGQIAVSTAVSRKTNRMRTVDCPGCAVGGMALADAPGVLTSIFIQTSVDQRERFIRPRTHSLTGTASMLNSQRNLKASDARDRVYALLGISEYYTRDLMPPEIVPDYTKSAVEVLRDASMIAIRETEGTLIWFGDMSATFLSVIWSNGHRRSRGGPDHSIKKRRLRSWLTSSMPIRGRNAARSALVTLWSWMRSSLLAFVSATYSVLRTF